MAGEIYRDGNIHLSPEIQSTFVGIANLVGAPNVPLIISKGNMHNASTDSKKVFMGGGYVALTMPGNYHGFDEAFVAAGAAFVIGHELGHITVHPGRGCSWREEIESLPIDAYEQMSMANIISDIMVNYMVSRGNNYIEDNTEFGNELKIKLLNGHEGSSFNRVGGMNDGGEGQLERETVSRLLATGVNSFGQPMIDNRYTPPPATGLSQGDYYPNAGPGKERMISEDSAEPTPLWQTKLGYGRGCQIYAPLQMCVGKTNPDTGQPFTDNWKTVRIKQTYNVQYCTPCKSYQIYQDIAGQCPICEGSTSTTATFRPGDYVVTRVMTFDGKINPEKIQPIANLEINGNWIPSAYADYLSPDTGAICNPNWAVHFGYRGEQSGSVFGSQRYTFGTRFLLLYEWAANYALWPEGYGGYKSRQAATQFIKDMGYTLHAATMEAGGVGA
jgi:hypothetical protein